MLPSNVEYLGSDLFPRERETLVWDLNSGVPPLKRSFDIAVFSGVLEYVIDPGCLLDELRRSVIEIAASYASSDEVPDRLTRLENGWVNHFSRAEFIDLMSSAGFTLLRREPWIDSSLYHFRAND